MKKLNEGDFIVAANAPNYQLTIKYFLKNSLRIQPENEIVYRDKLRYNYYEFNKRVNRLSNLFYSLGFKGNATIGVLDYDSHRFLECFFAIPCTGNILHTINWRLSPEQMIYTINHAEDTVLIMHEDFLPIIEKFKNQIKTVKTIILIRERENNPETTINFAGEYDELLLLQDEHFDYPDFSEDTIATIFYTSGTTGDPKGVYYSHRQLVLYSLIQMSCLGMSNAFLNLKTEDTYLPLTPMFHIHAWGIPYIATVLNLKQVYVGKFDPKTFLKVFIDEKPTLSHSVPAILNMILSHPDATDFDFSNWKILVGGSALPEPLAKKAIERGIRILAGYGMSETGGILTLSHLNHNDVKLDKEGIIKKTAITGKASIMTDVKLVDEKGNTIPKDGKTVGEIVARGPYLTNGYFKNPKASEELWKGGYLHTGDLAVWNENEDIKIVDRLKDVIKTGGEWISSIELESLILTHSSVAEVAVIGVPDKQWDERPLAIIVLRTNHNLSAEELREHLHQFVIAERINKWTIPEQIHFISEIPKTSVGKIDKKVIRNQYISR